MPELKIVGKTRVKLSGRVQKLEISPTTAVLQEANQLKRQGIDVIDFGPGEPDFSTPENVKEAAHQAIRENFTKYTEVGGILPLKQALADKYKKDWGAGYDAAEIIVCAGGKQALFNLALALFEEGDEVVIPAPYWVTFPEQVRLAGAVPVVAPVPEHERFILRAAMLEPVLTSRTRAIIVTSPNNPTGAVIPEEEVRRLVKLVRERGLLLISDETYEHFSYQTDRAFSASALRDEALQELIIVGAVSKTYAMTGWRIGYALGPRAIIAAATNIQSHATSNPASISQKAALEAITGDQGSVKVMKAEYRRRRDFAHAALAKVPGVSCDLPDGAFYLFPNVSRYLRGEVRDSAAFAGFLLREARVAVVPGSAFGAEGYIRISYATSMELLAEGIRRIEEALRKIKN
ncbi:MAG: pyridoxal phosphate-dependent aminotransferase [Acidobacteria bacterium]|nr:pyridoxal phosphate-dependent aminotransferase [Acidobacteriota bacterium]